MTSTAPTPVQQTLAASARNITKVYDSGPGTVTALDDVSRAAGAAMADAAGAAGPDRGGAARLRSGCGRAVLGDDMAASWPPWRAGQTPSARTH